MRKLIALGIVAALSSIASASDWKVVWSDEFEQAGAPDPEKWDYEVGFIRNNELGLLHQGPPEERPDREWRARPRSPQGDVSERPPRPASTRPIHAPFAYYTSGSITTKGKFTFTYGRVEVVAKLPGGSGVWPAIWTLGDDIDRIGWPACGEIDIMERFGQISDRISATLHYKRDGRHAQSEARFGLPDPESDYHTYAIEWDESRISCFVDEECFKTFDLNEFGEGKANPFRRPHFLILNLALASNRVVGDLDDSVLPQRMRVKSVRVLQKINTLNAASSDKPTQEAK